MGTGGRQPSAGFTLIEALVALAILGVLIGLILPAVQKARGAAQGAQCSNNLRQIGLAANEYHTAYSSFPSGVHVNQGNYLSSWLVDLLPYVERTDLWQATQDAYAQSPSPFNNPPHVGLAIPVAVYGCPADPRSQQAGFAVRSRIAVAFTSYLGVEGKDLNTNDGILFTDSRVRLLDVRDGASVTLLAGERPPSTDMQFGWWYAGRGQPYTGSLDMVLGVHEVNILPRSVAFCVPGPYQFGPGDLGNECDMFHFWSLHPGGANFLFADGAVHFLSYSAAPLLPALATRAGAESVTVP